MADTISIRMRKASRTGSGSGGGKGSSAYAARAAYANTAGYAELAEQFARTRKLWGQPFNGTRDVTGDLSSVGTLTFLSGMKLAGETVSSDTGDEMKQLHALGNVYADGFVSALMANPDAGVTTPGASYLRDLLDVDLPDDISSESVLCWSESLQRWTAGKVAVSGLTAADVTEMLSDYATKDWVTAQIPLNPGWVTETWVRNQGYITGLEVNLMLKGYAKTDHTHDNYLGKDDTAAAAAKLETTRQLWGQNFNGTQNVTGSLSSVGNISPSASNTYNVGSTTAPFAQVYARSLRNDINSYMLIYQAANNCIEFSTNKIARITLFNDTTDGAAGQMLVNTALLVGRSWHRGTVWNAENREAPALDVTGSAFFTKRIYLSSLNQDVFVEYDATNGMFYFSKGIYAAGAISALNSSNGLTELTVGTMNVQTVLNIGSRLRITPSNSTYQIIEPTRAGIHLHFGSTYSFANVQINSTMSATGLITAQAGVKLGTAGVKLEHYTDSKIKVTTNGGTVKYINLSTT